MSWRASVLRFGFSLTFFSLATSATAQGTASPCEVTLPNGETPPGEAAMPLYHGNGTLWTKLWPAGTVVFEPGGPGFVSEDGSLAMKFPWWRGSRGPLGLHRRRLDGRAPPFEQASRRDMGTSSFLDGAFRRKATGDHCECRGRDDDTRDPCRREGRLRVIPRPPPPSQAVLASQRSRLESREVASCLSSRTERSSRRSTERLSSSFR
jgi:hypothetical protein